MMQSYASFGPLPLTQGCSQWVPQTPLLEILARVGIYMYLTR